MTMLSLTSFGYLATSGQPQYVFWAPNVSLASCETVPMNTSCDPMVRGLGVDKEEAPTGLRGSPQMPHRGVETEGQKRQGAHSRSYNMPPAEPKRKPVHWLHI